MTQVQLARLAGVRSEAICRLEADAVGCSDLLALKLADALNVQVEAFTRPGQHPNRQNFRSSRRNAAA
jgi:DNA-binding XRE family transcriptional regulator